MPQNGMHPRPFIIIKLFHKMDAYGILLLLINCATKWDASETHGDICREPCSDSPKAHQWRTKGAPVRTQKCTSAHQSAPTCTKGAPTRTKGSPASRPRLTSVAPAAHQRRTRGAPAAHLAAPSVAHRLCLNGVRNDA